MTLKRKRGGAKGMLLAVVICACASRHAVRTTLSPIEGSTFHVGIHGFRMFVHEYGRGLEFDPGIQTVLAINGGWGISHDHLDVLSELATPTRRVVLYDQRGAGRSGEPWPRRAGLSVAASDVEGLRKRLGASKVHLIGHSWGGVIAISYAASHPDSVASLTLVDPAWPTQQETDVAKGRVLDRIDVLRSTGVLPARAPLGTDNDCTSTLDSWVVALNANPHLPPPISRSTCTTTTQYREWGASIGYNVCGDLAQLGRLRVPVLVVVGSADPWGDPSDSIAVCLGTKPAMERIESCGHRPMHECPVVFFDVVRTFLDANPG